MSLCWDGVFYFSQIMSFQKYAVIVAGGSGARMKSDVPKQFLYLAGRPLLMNTLEAFHRAEQNLSIILVLPQQHIAYWHELVDKHGFTVEHSIVAGGKTRSDSVYNGLCSIKSEGLVAIHDGARPLISSELINECYEVAADQGNAVVAVPVKDSIRRVTTDGNLNVDRSEYFIVQTPQTFYVSSIMKAFKNKQRNVIYSDDASVFEADGESIVLVKGSYDNIKITTPEDMTFAEALVNIRK